MHTWCLLGLEDVIRPPETVLRDYYELLDMGAGNQTEPSARAVSMLNCWAISRIPWTYDLNSAVLPLCKPGRGSTEVRRDSLMWFDAGNWEAASIPVLDRGFEDLEEWVLGKVSCCSHSVCLTFISSEMRTATSRIQFLCGFVLRDVGGYWDLERGRWKLGECC